MLNLSFSGEVILRDIDCLKVDKSIRSSIDWKDVKMLASSIRMFGILQPLLVTNDYHIVLGIRRYYAARLAGLKEVPVIITDLDNTVVEKQLISDLNTKHLTVIERALAFQDLLDKKYMTKYELARYLGFSDALICRTLAILKANPRTMQLLKDEKISQKVVATVLYRLKNKNLENYVIDKIMKEKLDIIQAGNLVAELNNPQIMKKHFIIKLKGFRTSVCKFLERNQKISLNEVEKQEIKKEIELIKNDLNNF